MSYFMVVSLLFLRNILGSRFIFYYGLPLPHPHTTYTQPAFGSDFFKRKGKTYPQSCKKLMIIIIKSVSMRFLLLLCMYLFSTQIKRMVTLRKATNYIKGKLILKKDDLWHNFMKTRSHLKQSNSNRIHCITLCMHFYLTTCSSPQTYNIR